MKYYKLKNSFKTKEIGVFAQAERINKLGDLENIYIDGRKKPINIQWDIPEPIMKNKSKPTTYLHVIPFSDDIFLVLKKYFIDFLKGFNVGDFNHWPLKVHHNDNILTDYQLFHLSYPTKVDNLIKYEQSDFVILPRGGRFENTPTKPVRLESYESFKNLKEVLNESNENITVSYDKLVVDFSDLDLDLFRFIEAPFTNGYYISERLKNAIEEQNFTGMAFQEIEEMDKRIKVIY